MNINLRTARERAVTSQAELATILGIYEPQVNHYEEKPGTIPSIQNRLPTFIG